MTARKTRTPAPGPTAAHRSCELAAAASLALSATILAAAATAAADVPAPVPVAGPVPVHTGGTSGAYHTTFCPLLVGELAKHGLSHVCTPSNGTEANMARIFDHPAELAYGQLDVLSLEMNAYGGRRVIAPVRIDDARECLYAVARNEALVTYGDIAARAGRLRFVLPPADSGSAGTFRLLQSIDPDLAAAGELRHVATAEDAIRLALSSDNAVAFFVQFPDPANARFKLVGELGGHFVPVIDRTILSRMVDGRHLYHAQETEVADASWLRGATSLVTACTPMVLFTGTPARLSDPDAAAAHGALIEKLAALSPEFLRPKDGLLASVLKRTRQLSASAVETLVGVSETARDKAKPLLDKAREATTKALEGAKPHVDQLKQSGADTVERAKDAVKEIIEPAPPAHAPPKP